MKGVAGTMTDASQRIPVAAIAGCLFCLVLIYLTLQIRAGNDPAIGAGDQAAATVPRKVIVRRVVVTGGGGGEGVSSAGSGSAPSVASSTPAAAASGPAPMPAPAAPAPAPVVSQGS